MERKFHFWRLQLTKILRKLHSKFRGKLRLQRMGEAGKKNWRGTSEWISSGWGSKASRDVAGCTISLQLL